MIRIIILGVLLHLGSITDSALNSSATFHIPASNFTLECVLPKTSHSTSERGFTRIQSFLQDSEEADYKINIYPVNTSSSNAAGLENTGGFGCHFMNDTNNCFISSELLETQNIKWNIMCWVNGNHTNLICTLIPCYKMTYLNAVFRIGYVAALVDISVERTKQQNCSIYDYFECVIPIINTSQSYILWIEVTDSKGSLRSPPMLVNPTSIYKPYAPTNLKTEIINEGDLRISWTIPTPAPCKLLYEVKYRKNSTENIFQNEVNVLEPSLHIGSIQSGFSYSFQVRCKCHNGNGFWSNWSNAVYFNTQEVIYFPQKLLASAGSNVTVSCIYYNKNLTVPVNNIVWWLNLDEQVSEAQYSVLNSHVARVTLLNLSTTNPEGKFNYHALYCCQKSNESIMCNHRYAELYVINVNLNFSCETNGNLTKMTCRWDISSLPDGSTLKLKFYRYKIYCSGLQNNQHNQEVNDCHLNGTLYYECTFTPIFSMSGYVLWLEIHHQLGILESPKSCIIPMDVVKPLPPSNVKAEITVNYGYLNITWERPSLPVDSLEFQIQYSVNGTDALWKIQNFLDGESSYIEVSDPCIVYITQVRCRRFNTTGYWSQWSEPAYTTIRDIRAPARGPDFWRIISEDPISKEKQVTLLWKPLTKEDALCTVKGIILKHQTSQNRTWTDILENKSRWTFAWTEDVHTVTVSAFNSVGSSVVNYNLTFSNKTSAVYAAQSLEAYLMNNTCVFLSWTIFSNENQPTCFIIEWKIPEEDDQVMWTRVPSNLSRFYIFDHFVPINKYYFTLYPIFPEGEGHPINMNIADKGNNMKHENDTEPYIILLIIVLSTILLIGTILISQQKMRKLFWEDVPNPQNCSWAQGVNFEKDMAGNSKNMKSYMPAELINAVKTP
ncbi:leptin receptor isoform X2 [Protopterus annectens]|uniref:leptin receptor isoform X2 n=1 Tax=Protopterus annectens TaxID=7888 RepID=UPI001CFB8AAE|nr:leptin receptor isoform X2 [Protopterus annectens]